MKDYWLSSTSSIAELLKIKIHISFPYFFSQNRHGSITYVQTDKPICLTVILVYINHFLLVLKYECSVQLYVQCSFLSHYWFFVMRQISVNNFPMICLKHGIKFTPMFILILHWIPPKYFRSLLYIKNHLVLLLVDGFNQLMTFQMSCK